MMPVVWPRSHEAAAAWVLAIDSRKCTKAIVGPRRLLAIVSLACTPLQPSMLSPRGSGLKQKRKVSVARSWLLGGLPQSICASQKWTRTSQRTRILTRSQTSVGKRTRDQQLPRKACIRPSIWMTWVWAATCTRLNNSNNYLQLQLLRPSIRQEEQSRFSCFPPTTLTPSTLACRRTCQDPSLPCLNSLWCRIGTSTIRCSC